MKMFNFYWKAMMLWSLIVIFSCSENPVEDNFEEIQNLENNPPLPLDPYVNVEILGHFNKVGELNGYYYYDNPSQVFPISKKSKTFQDRSKSFDGIISMVGDQDNFGYGGTAGPPCRLFNLSTSEDDIGNFDRLIKGSVDSEKSWTHDFRNDPLFCSAFIATEVVIKIREYFNDNLQTITIEIDGVEINFAQNGISRCQYPIVQTFRFSEETASFANDGIINISVKENGEEVALDYSLVTIKGYCNNIEIAGCDTDVPNQALNSGATMEEAILALVGSSESHGDFVQAVSSLLNEWKKSGLISGEEKELIMECAGDSNIGK